MMMMMNMSVYLLQLLILVQMRLIILDKVTHLGEGKTRNDMRENYSRLIRILKFLNRRISIIIQRLLLQWKNQKVR